ncbi:MAG: FAD:protein FMN transferase [Rhodothermales bacterium]
MKRIACIALALLALACSPARTLAQAGETLFEVNVGKYLMGTRVDATVRTPSVEASKRALVAAFQEMERVENLLSYHKPDSEISRINREAGRHPVHVSMETFQILQRSVAYARRFDGLFDVSIGPLSVRWGFSGDAPIVVPDRAAIDSLRALVDYRRIVLNAADTTVAFRTPGMRIDLGGIAKGYAIDRGVAVLREQGMTHFLLNAGGDIFAAGEKADGQPWRVGVKHPRNTQEVVAAFDAVDIAVATSGDYERYIDLDGVRYHHILDPRTGYPGTLSRSATIVAPTAEEADAMATYLFLIGPAGAAAGRIDAPFLVIGADGSLHAGDRLRAYQLETWE